MRLVDINIMEISKP